ncbi:MAG: TolC family outer membrane protein [Methyloglobulus sp.]|nr:TolC family outer membrane protein [Methyloglobulus sp.]
MTRINPKASQGSAIRIAKPSIFLVLLISLYLSPLQAENLLTVYNQAVQEDPQLERAREALEAVKETQTQASASLFLPEAYITGNINTDWQHIKNRGNAIIAGDPTQTATTSENFNTLSYTLSVTQPILHYDRIVQWQQADSRIAQGIAQFASAESALLLRVAERYFAVLAAEENLSYAKAQQESLAQKLGETKLHEAAGYLAMTDVQEAQGGSDRAIADAIKAEHQLRDARESLQEVTGIHYNQLAALKEDIPLVQPEPAVEGTWVEQALSQNLGLKASEHASQIAKTEIDVQKAGHWPTIDATGSHSFNATGGRFGAADIEDNTLGLSLNVPLFQGGKVSSRIREAEHRYREAKAAFKQEQRAVQRIASQAFLGVTAGISRVKALQQTLKSSTTAVRGTEAGFRAGYRTPLDVIIAERERLNAQRDYTQARYDYILSTLRLKQAVGTLAPEDLAKVNEWLGSTPIDKK